MVLNIGYQHIHLMILLPLVQKNEGLFFCYEEMCAFSDIYQ